MKNTVKLILCLVVIAGCKKEKSTGRITFYQLTYAGSPSLYVDGNRIGTLRKITQMPVCGDNVTNSIITVDLTYGEHQFWIDDNSGSSVKYYYTVSEECKQVQVK